MSKTDMDVYKENLRLKKEFLKRNLDLEAVMDFMPYYLEIENKRLQSLLTFLEKYRTCEDRKTMELLGMMFPPIFPMISPEEDWHRFELWYNGKEVRKKLIDQIAIDFPFKSPKEITEEEAIIALEKLEIALNKVGFGFSLNEGIPAKLVYEYLLETLEEVHEISGEGGWWLDGCSGYCPGCFQRPWCESGLSGVWKEDEDAGKMDLIKSVQEYVSAAPNSLAVLKEFDEFAHLEDEQVEKNQDTGHFHSPLNAFGIENDPTDDLPFNYN